MNQPKMKPEDIALIVRYLHKGDNVLRLSDCNEMFLKTIDPRWDCKDLIKPQYLN